MKIHITSGTLVNSKLAFGLIVATVIAGANGIVGAAVSELFTTGGYNALLALIFGLGIIAVGLWFGIRLASEILTSRARLVVSKDETRRKVLIMGLSAEAPEVLELYRLIADAIGPESLAAPVGDFTNRIKALNTDGLSPPLVSFVEKTRENDPNDRPPLLRWQQNLRAISHHVGDDTDSEWLRGSYVLPSKQSSDQFDNDFKPLVKELFPGLRVERVMNSNRASPFTVAEGMNYESYEYVHEGLRRAVEQAKREISECDGTQDICIDCSAGMKTFSFAAAIVTLNNDILLGYITNAGEPKFYDAAVSFIPTPS